jgi:hypothetical protein
LADHLIPLLRSQNQRTGENQNFERNNYRRDIFLDFASRSRLDIKREAMLKNQIQKIETKSDEVIHALIVVKDMFNYQMKYTMDQRVEMIQRDF